MRCSALLAVAICLLAGAADPPKTQRDPQAAFEPRSAPGAGQKFLERFVGDWDVAKTFHPRSGEPSRTKGSCRQTMIHDGRFLQSEFRFEQDGKTSTGLGLIGFEPATGKFTSVWTDSRQTKMSLRHSRDPFDGERIVLYSGSLETDAKDARQSRTVTVLEDKGNRVVHRQFAISADAGERLMMELVMTRRPVPSAETKSGPQE